MGDRWPTVIYGRRKFAWRWTAVENRMRVRWRWVVELRPMGGRLPTWNGEVMTHTTAVPFSHASPIKQFTFDLWGYLMYLTNKHRALIAAFMWLVAVECLTIMVSFVFGYPPEFGGWRVGLPVPFYVPGAFVWWHGLIDPGYRWISTGAMVAAAIVGVALLARLLFDNRRAATIQSVKATQDDVRAGFYGDKAQARKDRLV